MGGAGAVTSRAFTAGIEAADGLVEARAAANRALLPMTAQARENVVLGRWAVIPRPPEVAGVEPERGLAAVAVVATDGDPGPPEVGTMAGLALPKCGVGGIGMFQPVIFRMTGTVAVAQVAVLSLQVLVKNRLVGKVVLGEEGPCIEVVDSLLGLPYGLHAVTGDAFVRKFHGVEGVTGGAGGSGASGAVLPMTDRAASESFHVRVGEFRTEPILVVRLRRGRVGGAGAMASGTFASRCETANRQVEPWVAPGTARLAVTPLAGPDIGFGGKSVIDGSAPGKLGPVEWRGMDGERRSGGMAVKASRNLAGAVQIDAVAYLTADKVLLGLAIVHGPPFGGVDATRRQSATAVSRVRGGLRTSADHECPKEQNRQCAPIFHNGSSILCFQLIVAVYSWQGMQVWLDAGFP